MPLKQFFIKINQTLFSESILKLFFSYKGSIARIPYITAILLLWAIEKLCIINFLTFIFVYLFLIYCWAALIQKRSRSFNSTGTWYIFTNFLFIYTLCLIYGLDMSFFPVIKGFVYLIGSITVIANLILVMRPTQKEVDKQKRSFLTHFPVVFTILAFAGIFLVFELKDRYMPDTNRPAFHLGLSIGEIYRHTYGYPEFCKAQGYEMVNYPLKVREKFKKEIEIAENDQMALLAKATTKNYKSIQDFYTDEDVWGNRKKRLEVPTDFFEALRQRLILLEIAEERQIDKEQVKVTKEDEGRVSLKDACKFVDEDAEYFVSSDCPFSYILNYAGKYSDCGTYFNTKRQE